jgi:hypothetical protein
MNKFFNIADGKDRATMRKSFIFVDFITLGGKSKDSVTPYRSTALPYGAKSSLSCGKLRFTPTGF